MLTASHIVRVSCLAHARLTLLYSTHKRTHANTHTITHTRTAMYVCVCRFHDVYALLHRLQSRGIVRMSSEEAASVCAAGAPPISTCIFGFSCLIVDKVYAR